MEMLYLEQDLFKDVSSIIEQGRIEISRRASFGAVLLFWKVGQRVNKEILGNQRADYGKKIVS